MTQHSSRPLAAAAVIGALVLALTGCGPDAGGASKPDGKLSVLASFYPLQFLAQRVGGDRVEVGNLTPPGAEPHDLELSPAQISQMSGADLVVYEKGFQAAVDDAVAQERPAHVVDAAEHADLQTIGEEEAEEHTDEAETGETHDHGALDPHFWLDPTRLPAVADAIAAQLGQVDPEHAEQYRSNAAAVRTDMTALDQEYRAGLANCRLHTFVTTHQAFGYLATRYGLVEFSFSGIDPEGEPSPARMQQVTDLAKKEQLTTLFVEPSVSTRAASALATDLGMSVKTLDPVETQASPSRDYVAVMRTNLDELAASMDCGR